MSSNDLACCQDFFATADGGNIESDRRAGGSFGLQLLFSRKGPAHASIPALPVFTINACLTGTCGLWIDLGDGAQIQRNIPPDTINIVPPDTAAEALVESSSATLSVTFDWAELAPLLARYNIPLTEFGHFFGKARVEPTAVNLIRRLWALAQEPQNRLYLDAATLELLAVLSSEPGLSTTGAGGAEDLRIQRVVDYIEVHLGQELSIGELADVAALSPGYLGRTFRTRIGESLWKYVTRRRCEAAHERLLATDRPLSEIALESGFAHQSHFNNAMKKYFGRTPLQIRAER